METFGSEPLERAEGESFLTGVARIACPKRRARAACEERDAPLNLEVGVGGGTRLLKPLLPLKRWKLLISQNSWSAQQANHFDRGARLACPKTERCAGRERNRDAPLNLEVGVGGGTRLKPLLPSSSLPSRPPRAVWPLWGARPGRNRVVYTFYGRKRSISARREKLHGTRTIKTGHNAKKYESQRGKTTGDKNIFPSAPADVETFGSEPPGARSRRIIFDRGARLACPKTERCARRREETGRPLNLEVA
ncbi:hypothetical protein GBF38_000052 [Nibea albiflora]|nr:hypothetical protein GBF38_000052 [Nibea albiflora]